MSQSWDDDDFVLRKLSRIMNETYADCESPVSHDGNDNYRRDGETNPAELKEDIYVGETHLTSPDIPVPEWAEGVEDYTLGMAVDPDGFRIEMEAEYLAPDVDGDATHNVKLFKNTDDEQFPASVVGQVPPAGKYFAEYDLDGPESKSGSNLVSFSGEAPSLEHPCLFGSKGGEISEPQAAVFLAEWTNDRMQKSHSNFRSSGIASLSRGSKAWPNKADPNWAKANFMYNDDEIGAEYPTAASKIALKGRGVYDVDEEQFEPSGIDPFDMPLEDLNEKLKDFFPETEENSWVEGEEPFWYSPPESENKTSEPEAEETLTSQEREDILEEIDQIKSRLG